MRIQLSQMQLIVLYIIISCFTSSGFTEENAPVPRKRHGSGGVSQRKYTRQSVSIIESCYPLLRMLPRHIIQFVCANLSGFQQGVQREKNKKKYLNIDNDSWVSFLTSLWNLFLFVDCSLQVMYRDQGGTRGGAEYVYQWYSFNIDKIIIVSMQAFSSNSWHRRR